MRLTERDIIDRLSSQIDLYKPLEIIQINQESNYKIDAIIEFTIQGGPSFEAMAEVVTRSTPKIIYQKSNLLKDLFSEFGNRKLVPMIVAPYISKIQSTILSEQGISWIDLSGNMLLNIPPEIYIERTGKPNKFPDTAPIKKVFEGTSSLVSRALLLRPEGFSSSNEIVEFINERNGQITAATVSKVLKSLEEELLISRTNSNIFVKQPQQLLGNLAEGYADYSRRKKNSSYKYDIDNINDLFKVFYEKSVDYAYCGFYAAQIKGYGVTEQATVFLKSMQDIKKLFKNMPDVARADEEYGQVTFIETKNPCVWFNNQGESYEKIIDDLELYLEMNIDSPRGPKIAKQLKERILGKFNG